MSPILKFAPLVGAGLLLAACGTTVTERAATGALGGAAVGAAVGGGDGALAGAAIGGVAGAATTNCRNTRRC
ncbi:hypothetical protein [Caulobacter sp. NIBR2454]|uniref:hypothetical protein n=1 Tax=Caulobacter sp. NIBR2454 TaxID=3015996 RepID=UPI0022B74DB1|nr:hypothetical protein [Caulobacter sp. NIBR2454]